jgi:hypothetical protein
LRGYAASKLKFKGSDAALKVKLFLILNKNLELDFFA